MLRSLQMFSIVALMVPLLSLGGCSSEGKKPKPKLGKVKGIVKYKGQPVSDAIVVFTTEGAPRAAFGKTDSSGGFKLTTYDTNDGAPVGTHKVTVSKPTTFKHPSGKDIQSVTMEDIQKYGYAPASKSEGLPAKYTDINTTPLQYTVEAGENEKAIDLED
jgi:hypothetical protein